MSVRVVATVQGSSTVHCTVQWGLGVRSEELLTSHISWVGYSRRDGHCRL